MSAFVQRWGKLLAVVFVVVVGGLYLRGLSEKVRDNAIASCERGNKSRAGTLHLLNDLVEINRRRVKAASSPDEARANQYAKNQYQADRWEFVRAQREVAVRHGSVKVDCEAANQ